MHPTSQTPYLEIHSKHLNNTFMFNQNKNTLLFGITFLMMGFLAAQGWKGGSRNSGVNEIAVVSFSRTNNQMHISIPGRETETKKISSNTDGLTKAIQENLNILQNQGWEIQSAAGGDVAIFWTLSRPK